MSNKIFERILFILGFIVFIPQCIILIYRFLCGKETNERILERFAIASDLPSKKLIWIHAASVGEIVIAFSLVDIILKHKKSQNFLITSGTSTSANLAASKIEHYNITHRRSVVIHQFLPIDNYFLSKRFLDYWSPGLGLIIESELWPNIITSASKKFPLLLVNARMSERSFKRWLYFKSIIQTIGSKFSGTLAQSKQDYDHFKALGFQNVKLLGNIKYVQKDQMLDEILFDELSKATKSRKILFAASTHSGEEEIIINIYKNLKFEFKNLLLIIAPRHPNRAEEIFELATKEELISKIRSKGEKIQSKTDLYILDTIGEMHNVFSLKPLTFMGGSFDIRIGGHNILEPARYNCPIIFGPNMNNSIEISKEFLEKNAALQAENERDLEIKIHNLLSLHYSSIKSLTKAASLIIESKQSIEKEYIKEILNHIKM